MFSVKCKIFRFSSSGAHSVTQYGTDSVSDRIGPICSSHHHPSSFIIILSVPSKNFTIGFVLHNQSHFPWRCPSTITDIIQDVRKFGARIKLVVILYIQDYYWRIIQDVRKFGPWIKLVVIIYIQGGQEKVCHFSTIICRKWQKLWRWNFHN